MSRFFTIFASINARAAPLHARPRATSRRKPQAKQGRKAATNKNGTAGKDRQQTS